MTVDPIPDQVTAYLDDAQKRYRAFGESDAMPRLLAAVEAVLELARQPSTGIPPVVIREAISAALLPSSHTVHYRHPPACGAPLTGTDTWTGNSDEVTCSACCKEAPGA
jgi:hypothetical protein